MAIRATHPIGLYYIERSGFIYASFALLKSYRTSTQHLNLRLTPENRDLVDALNIAAEYLFSRPTLATDLDDVDKQRLSLYYRMFGLKIPGKEGVPVPTEYNPEFEVLFNRIMINIFQGIHDRRDPLRVETSDPVTLRQLLNDLRGNLDDHYVNDILVNFDRWWAGVQILIGLIEDPDSPLPRALGIVSNRLDTRVSQIGQRVGVPVNNFESYLELSTSMSEFLSEIETTNWDAARTQELYSRHDFFRALANAWLVMEPTTDFSRMALETRSNPGNNK